MEDLIRILKQTDLFHSLSEEVIRREILPLGQTTLIPKGQFLIMPQQKLDRFGILLAGRIHIMHIFSDGSYSLMSALMSPDALGADLVCTKTQISPYHALAVETVQLIYFPITMLTRPGLLREPCRLDVLNQMLMLIANENMKKEYRLAILSQKGLRERILTYLTMQAGKLRQSTFAISFSREVLASFLCVNRSALSHELSQMQQEGLIRFHKNVFTLTGWEDGTL